MKPTPWAFTWEPLFLALAVVAALVYLRAARNDRPSTARATVFALGLVLIVAALCSPLETIARRYLLLFHLLAASGAALLVLVSWWLHRPGRGTEPVLLAGYRIPIELLGVVLVAATAHLGGFLSGVNT